MFIAIVKAMMMLAQTFFQEMKLAISPEEKPSTDVPNPTEANSVEPQSEEKPTQA